MTGYINTSIYYIRKSEENVTVNNAYNICPYIYDNRKETDIIFNIIYVDYPWIYHIFFQNMALGPHGIRTGQYTTVVTMQSE